MKFYVYEHWRPDLDLCFYVGKGKGRRAYQRRDRNSSYRDIVALLADLGMCVEVRMVASGLDEDAAFSIERERIGFWRGVGAALTNRTDGGEGFCGFKRPLGIRLSEAAKKKIATARRGMKFSPEHRAKLAARKAGKPRKPFTDETRQKMRIASAEREAAKRDLYGSEVRRDSRIKVVIS